MRYLWHAFLARPDIPLLRLPWNALAVVAAGVAGFWDPAIWGVAAAGEMVYLFTMASNPGFQDWIEEKRLERLRGDSPAARRRLAGRLGGAARQRYRKLEAKRERLESLYRESHADDLLVDNNRDALRKLTWLYLNLLAAQRVLTLSPAAGESELTKQITQLEHEMERAESSSVRDAKRATAALLRERLENVRHRAISFEEIDADLSRIETQFDFALEEAALRGRPTAISANVELTSHLLSNLDDDLMTAPAPRSMTE